MRQLYVNLPVKDVERSKQFFAALGFELNEEFSDENAACVVFSDGAYAMLLDEEFFRRFLDGEIAYPGQGTQVLNALSADSREEVDHLMERALEAGGSEHIPRDPVEMEQMYVRAFKDPDGHVWEILHMEMG
jgi:predicted lactoylglutathione lyase